MRMTRKIALILALCLLALAPLQALAEEGDIQYEMMEAEVAPAEFAGDGTGLEIEEEGETDLPGLPGEEVQTDDGIDDGEGYAIDAPLSDMYYARTACGDAPVYCDELTLDALGALSAGEVVLVTGAGFGLVNVAMNAGGSVIEGYMDPSALAPLEPWEADAYLDAAATGEVALYAGDLNWPLGRLGEASAASLTDLMASSNYTEYGNDTTYTINGKTIYASMFPDTGAGNCWAWAQKVYLELWGVHFNSTFEGTAATGLNMLRNLSDAERLLTPEHLKLFVQNAVPGSTIRVSSCTSDCSEWTNDGLRCGHKGHSLIIASWNGDGVFTLDSHSNSQHTRFYSWQGFCNSWKNYDHIKYIKWPNAPALPPTETVDGIAVRSYEATYRVRATATEGAKLYSSPKDGQLLGTLAYPALFKTAKRSNESIGGATWVYGITEAGATGWLALDGSVADVNDAIPVTGVALSSASLKLLEGKSAALTAAVAPLDATDQGLTWSSSDDSVATASNGTVTGVKAGAATITVASADGKQTASCAVTVVKATGEKTLKKTGSNGTVKLAPGMKLQLVPKFATSKGWKVKSVKSSSAKVATVDKTGVVTAVAEGKTTITVLTKNNKKATLTIKVIDPYKASKVVLNKKKTVTLKKGKTLKLAAAVSPSTAVTSLTWKSSKPSVAKVDQNGKVTALKKGTCYIGVKTDNGKYAKVKIKVS